MGRTVSVEIEQVGPSTGQATARTHTVFVDRPTDKGGHDRGPLGGEYLLVSLGGWSGTDSAVTLAEFQQLVADGQVHYYIGGGMGGSSDSTAFRIAEWVRATYPATDVGGRTVYDLTTG